MFLWSLLAFLSAFVGLGALVPLIRSDAWWIRSFDFPRAQFFVLGIAVSVIFSVSQTPFTVWDYWLLGVLVCSVGLLGYRIYPYTRLAPKQVLDNAGNDRKNTISLLCANVLQYNRDASRLITFVGNQDPDIVLVVETDQWWDQALADIEERFPYQLKCPLDNTYGMLFYSRLKVVSAEIKYLVEAGVPSIFSEVLLPGGQKVEVIGIHPRPPRPDKLQDSTARDAELLIVAKYVAHVQAPVIVAGDFNDVAWSHSTRLFQRIGGLLDPRRGRGFFNTFHADYPFLRYPLDHIFHSHHFGVQKMKRLGHVGSDHFPVFATLGYNTALDQDEPTPVGDDDAEAKEMIRKAFE